jgi:hypothetical protein
LMIIQAFEPRRAKSSRALIGSLLLKPWPKPRFPVRPSRPNARGRLTRLWTRISGRARCLTERGYLNLPAIDYSHLAADEKYDFVDEILASIKPEEIQLTDAHAAERL